MSFSAADPTRRFSTRVGDYVRCRPSYPDAAIALLREECGLGPGVAVADVGSGTGLLAKLLLECGAEVYGVEPNGEMRLAGEAALAGHGRFHSVEGRAESTTLGPGSVRLIVAGQAFHWFEPKAARGEFVRILAPGGLVALIWNERLVGATPLLAAYEELLQRYAADYREVDHRRVDPEAIARFFGEHSAWRSAVFGNRQWFDREGLKGRVRSSSYVPEPGAPGHSELMAEIDALFERYQEEGQVPFVYETKVYYGPLPPD
jgi:SAM-dependent methyltransferase